MKVLAGQRNVLTLILSKQILANKCCLEWTLNEGWRALEFSPGQRKVKEFSAEIHMASEVYAKISQSKKKRGAGIEA